jgi:hypothetical protein
MGMAVRIITEEVTRHEGEAEYLRVQTFSAPDDDTVTLATIQRVVDKNSGLEQAEPLWRVKTIVLAKPMSEDQAVGFAARYAERKGISVVYKSE